jgi:hypothetical protein
MIYPQEPAAYPYREPDQSSPRPSLHVANGARSDLPQSQAVQYISQRIQFLSRGAVRWRSTPFHMSATTMVLRFLGVIQILIAHVLSYTRKTSNPNFSVFFLVLAVEVAPLFVPHTPHCHHKQWALVEVSRVNIQTNK